MATPAEIEACTRTYQYLRPAPERLHDVAFDGLDMLLRIVTGELPAPPMAATLGFSLVHVDRGRATFEGTPAEWQCNPLGTVHGGWIAAILDSALGCAVHTILGKDEGYATTDLQVRFLRPLNGDSGVVRAEARIVHPSARLATAEARLVGRDDNRLYATATAACMVRAR